VTPNADAREEVGLRRGDVFGLEVFDAAVIDDSGSDVAGGHEVVKPLCGVRLVFVIEGRHARPFALSTRSRAPARSASAA
jgi:hypothetical protein